MSNATGEIPRHELLLKLLKMTNSPNDAEALVAVRKANALLASAGWDWDKLLSGKITVIGDPFGNLQRPQEQPTVNPANFRQPQAPSSRPAAQFTPSTPPGAAAAAQAQAQAYFNQQQGKTARSRAKRPVVNYDDIFSDAQAFGRTS